MNTQILEVVTLVVCGGLFGWLLGKMPPRVVYGIAAVAVLLVLVLFTVN